MGRRARPTWQNAKALTEAQKKTEGASPALSQQVLSQIQADPAIAKLVSSCQLVSRACLRGYMAFVEGKISSKIRV